VLVSEPVLLTVREAALYLRGADGPPEVDFVRGLILDGRISAIKHRGRWMVQRASLQELATPKLAEQATAKPPRRVAIGRQALR